MVKNTAIVSALALSLVLVASFGSKALAQEYITTQSAELNQAIARAEKAQQDAAAAGSVRGKQISNYIGGVLEQARKNGYTNAEDLTRVLNDAATATPLLLGTSTSNTQTNTPTGATSIFQIDAKAVDTATDREATASKNFDVANANSSTESSITTSANNRATSAQNTPAKAVAPEVTTQANSDQVVANTVSTQAAAKTAGTGVTLKVEVKPEATTANTRAKTDTVMDAETVTNLNTAVASDAQNRVILANATVRSTVNDINANAEPAEVPNTGESKNTLGKIIATAMAAIVAMFGAVMIVKRIKKNA